MSLCCESSRYVAQCLERRESALDFSVFLLRGFGTKRRRSEVYRLDRSDGSLSCERVERVASRSFLMTELDDQVLRVIEDRASQSVSLLRKSRFGLFAEADRRALDLLVLSLVFNHPSWIPEKERIRREVVWERGLDVMRANPIYGTAVLGCVDISRHFPLSRESNDRIR